MLESEKFQSNFERNYCCCVELPFHVLFSSSESFVSLKRCIFEPVTPTRLYGPLCDFESSDDDVDADGCWLPNRRIRFLALQKFKIQLEKRWTKWNYIEWIDGLTAHYGWVLLRLLVLLRHFDFGSVQRLNFEHSSCMQTSDWQLPKI